MVQNATAGEVSIKPAENRAGNQTDWTAKARSDGKKVVKLSPQPATTSQAAAAGSGSVSLVHNQSTSIVAAPPQAKLPELTASTEPLQWHPPYRADLAGFVIPTVIMAADWQLWFEDQLETVQPAQAPMGMRLLLMR